MECGYEFAKLSFHVASVQVNAMGGLSTASEFERRASGVGAYKAHLNVSLLANFLEVRIVQGVSVPRLWGVGVQLYTPLYSCTTRMYHSPPRPAPPTDRLLLSLLSLLSLLTLYPLSLRGLLRMMIV